MSFLKFFIPLLVVSAVSANLLNEMAGEAETLDLAKSNYQINSREVGDRFRRQVSSESSEPLDSNPSSTGSILTTFDRRPSSSVSTVPVNANGTIRVMASNVTERGLERSGTSNYPNTDSCVYKTNCEFIGLQLYVVLNILDAVTCGNVVCGGDDRCTHFNYNSNTKTCSLVSAALSAGVWSTLVPSPSGLICGHIPRRSCGTGSLISLCLGLSLNIL